MMEWINCLSLFFSFCACIVPVIIYFLEKKDKKKDKQQECKDELDAWETASKFPRTPEDRQEAVRRQMLEKGKRR